ncbi:hypothetical protein KP509_35G024900 [Ceratopteris richardii]|uniref:Uncharacterized protein n=1 Tax=Ceratopteris richardii TaxID=49495 RepID=A0A8T2QE31_CERRI|nr:hypothetical protein KP509_35G024900 [Ceratopteris richardii]
MMRNWAMGRGATKLILNRYSCRNQWSFWGSERFVCSGGDSHPEASVQKIVGCTESQLEMPQAKSSHMEEVLGSSWLSTSNRSRYGRTISCASWGASRYICSEGDSQSKENAHTPVSSTGSQSKAPDEKSFDTEKLKASPSPEFFRNKLECLHKDIQSLRDLASQSFERSTDVETVLKTEMKNLRADLSPLDALQTLKDDVEKLHTDVRTFVERPVDEESSSQGEAVKQQSHLYESLIKLESVLKEEVNKVSSDVRASLRHSIDVMNTLSKFEVSLSSLSGIRETVEQCSELTKTCTSDMASLLSMNRQLREYMDDIQEKVRDLTEGKHSGQTLPAALMERLDTLSSESQNFVNMAVSKEMEALIEKVRAEVDRVVTAGNESQHKAAEEIKSLLQVKDSQECLYELKKLQTSVDVLIKGLHEESQNRSDEKLAAIQGRWEDMNAAVQKLLLQMNSSFISLQDDIKAIKEHLTGKADNQLTEFLSNEIKSSHVQVLDFLKKHDPQIFLAGEIKSSQTLLNDSLRDSVSSLSKEIACSHTLLLDSLNNGELLTSLRNEIRLSHSQLMDSLSTDIQKYHKNFETMSLETLHELVKQMQALESKVETFGSVMKSKVEKSDRVDTMLFTLGSAFLVCTASICVYSLQVF